MLRLSVITMALVALLAPQSVGAKHSSLRVSLLRNNRPTGRGL